MDNLKQIIRLAIDTNVPAIIKIKGDIELLTKEKQELKSKIDVLNVELGIHEEECANYENVLLGLMESHSIKKMTTSKYAVEQCRNANPTVEVVELTMVPKRYIVEVPQVDKRSIQSEYVNNKIIPPGVSIKYGQYLNIIERRKE